jgi:hypothetical protein
MSLDISKLEHVRAHARKTTARCPACAEPDTIKREITCSFRPMGDSAVWFTLAIPRMRERTGNAFSLCAGAARSSR